MRRYPSKRGMSRRRAYGKHAQGSMYPRKRHKARSKVGMPYKGPHRPTRSGRRMFRPGFDRNHAYPSKQVLSRQAFGLIPTDVVGAPR